MPDMVAQRMTGHATIVVMRSLLPPVNDEVDLDQLAALYAYPDTGLLRANMVTSLDGAATADGRSDPISGPADKYLFGVLRALADVIVVGAGTARAEGYGPGRSRSEFARLREAAGQSAAPTMAVVTRSADLDPSVALFSAANPRTIVITCEAAPRERRSALAEVADVEVCGEDGVELALALTRLNERGLPKSLTEGGPRLLADLLAADLVEEVALSVSPVVAGGSAGRIVHGSALLLQRLRLRSLLESDSFLFALYGRSERTPS